MVLRALFLLSIYAVMQLGWSFARGSAMETLLIHQWTAAPAAGVINWFTPTVQARANGPRIVAPGGGINILNGCEGTEVFFLVAAACLVTPIAWPFRLLGLLAAAPLVWMLNQGRVLALFYTYRADREWFAILHGTLAPLVMVSACALLFFLFIRWAQGSRHPARA